MRYALVSLLLLGLLAAVAAAAPWQEQARALADPATQRQALERLARHPEPALHEVLQALKDGALYRWQGKLYVFRPEGVFVDLAGQPLLDARGAPLFPETGLEAVPLAEANLPLLQRILDALALFAPEAAQRQATALRLGNLRDAGVIPLLEAALQREPDPAVRAVLTASLWKLRLFDPDPQVRRQAVAFFGAQRAEAALSRLYELRRQEQVPQVQAALEQAIARIEGFLRLRRSIGYVFNGLSLASILLLMSLGLAITFGLMGIINMAHGELLMLGSYTAYVLQEAFAAHLPAAQAVSFVVALPLSLLGVGAVGWLMERGLLRFLYGRPLESLLITWGLGLILQQGARLYFGDQTSVSPPAWLRGGWEPLPGLVLPYSRLFILALAAAALGAVYALLYRSPFGLRVRAVMQNRDMAACMGIATRRVDALTFALGAALAGVAGCALSLVGTVDPEVGKTYIVDAFLVVVLGGVGKLLGTVLAAFGIGMTNKLLEPAIGGTAAAVYAKVAILGLVIFFLQRKPTGLFPARERTSEVS